MAFQNVSSMYALIVFLRNPAEGFEEHLLRNKTVGAVKKKKNEFFFFFKFVLQQYLSGVLQLVPSQVIT